MTAPPRSPIFFFLFDHQRPWLDRDDRRGDGIAGMWTPPGSLLSCHSLAKGARASLLSFSSPLLLYLRFLPSRLREIRSRRRSAALKPICRKWIVTFQGETRSGLIRSRRRGGGNRCCVFVAFLFIGFISAEIWRRRIYCWFQPEIDRGQVIW